MANTPVDRIFLDHCREVDESYFEHMRFALGFAGTLAFAAGAALVHAVIPALCETTASRAIKRMHAKIENRHHDAPAPKDARAAT